MKTHEHPAVMSSTHPASSVSTMPLPITWRFIREKRVSRIVWVTHANLTSILILDSLDGTIHGAGSLAIRVWARATGNTSRANSSLRRTKGVPSVIRITFTHLTPIFICPPDDGTVHGAGCPAIRPNATVSAMNIEGGRDERVERMLRVIWVTLAHLTPIFIHCLDDTTILRTWHLPIRMHRAGLG